MDKFIKFLQDNKIDYSHRQRETERTVEVPDCIYAERTISDIVEEIHSIGYLYWTIKDFNSNITLIVTCK